MAIGNSLRRDDNSSRRRQQKVDCCNEVLSRLKQSSAEAVNLPGFEDELWSHFNRLPSRYASDVNLERAEDVLMHKRLLELACNPANRPAFCVRVVQVSSLAVEAGANFFGSNSPPKDEEYSFYNLNKQSAHPPPTFVPFPNLEALTLTDNKLYVLDGDGEDQKVHANSIFSRPMHEITFSSYDKPKLLSLLTSLLAEIGLNIHEAHIFSTIDGYSLDVFLVDGWPHEETEKLRLALETEISNIETKTQSKPQSSPFMVENVQSGIASGPDNVKIPSDGSDVWEIDTRLLNFDGKMTSGSFGDLYRGTYCSQDVAIKVLKPECMTLDMQHEFAKEVFIMRKVRHKNVVQFIGACTKPPSLCIVTEYMSRGSIYDFLHKQKGVFKLPSLLRAAIDISKGMNYLHQNNIIHRDLKAANLLIDENEVVKVADFGVARVKAHSGVMTAETGTYRWMAPEVIEHRPYDHKADIFSYGIVLWELITGKVPYEYITPLQAAVGVVQKGLRPTIPKHTHPKLAQLLERCWHQDPSLRPEFSEIIELLQVIARQVESEGDKKTEKKEKTVHRFLSVLKRIH